MTAMQITRNMDDLHLADKMNREWLRTWMAAEQKRQALPDKMISERVGHQGSWASGLTSGTMWRASSVQKFIRGVGRELVFKVDIGWEPQPLPEGTVTLSEVYQNHPDMEQREEAARRDLCQLGARLREAAGLTTIELGKKLNIDPSSVRAFESGDKPFYLLVTAQRYFRGLGGELNFVIKDPTGQAISYVSPGDKAVAAALKEVNVSTTGGRVMIWNKENPSVAVSFSAEGWKTWLKANVG